jgi:hypothetical protein
VDHELASQRFFITCELHDAGVEFKRQQIHRKHPDWSDAEVGKALQAWLLDRPGAPFGDVGGDVVVRVLR